MLFQYNGVNLRCANYEQAAKILKESGNSVTILAQFNPQRAQLEGDFDIGNSSASETSSTACSTPVNRRKVKRDDSTITPPLPKDEKVITSNGITDGHDDDNTLLLVSQLVIDCHEPEPREPQNIPELTLFILTALRTLLV